MFREVSEAPFSALAQSGAGKGLDLAVVCRKVTKELGTGETRTQVLRGIDMELPSGELTLLVGPSGCGKTTLISIIAGLLEPTTGEVDVLGTRLTALSDRAKIDFRGKDLVLSSSSTTCCRR